MDRHSAEQPNDSVPLPSLGAPPGNLPDELTSFVGRSVELARVRELLGEARLLTLVGGGGCGKTRLALQSATLGVERFPDGVCWVELAAIENDELLVTTVTSTLGLRDRPGQAPAEVLCEHFSERRALLVFDNCEHLLAACATLVNTLLRACRGLVVLATSREALQVPGELPYRVPSLNLPAQSASLRAVRQSDAVRLFIDRAVQARPSFAMIENNAQAVVTICRRLDGIPLAIELAAARVRMLSPEQIAGELDDRFHLLTGGGRTVAPRHQTLRASIDWSHQLCSEQERVLLRRLSVWTGGWTLDGAEAVSSDETLYRPAVLDLLTGLLDKSLIETEEREGEIRYAMLETIRQYAAEKLAEAGEVSETHDRHLAWCLELAERAEPELVRHDARRWLSRLEPEVANLRAAMERAVADEGDDEAALRLGAALTFFWLMRGRLEEGVLALARVLDVAPQPSAMRGRVLWALAELNIWRGRFGDCLEYAKRALADGEAVGDRSVMARALRLQGHIISLPNHLKRGPLERSIALAREAGDEWCTADTMRLLASTYVRQSEHEAARPILEEDYALVRALGYQPLYAWYFTLRACGEVEHGRLRAGRELAEQAAAASNEVGDPISLGLATTLLVQCDVLQGLLGQGRSRAEPFVEVMRTRGVVPAHLWVETALALVDVAEGLPDAARARIEAMLPYLASAPAYNSVWWARRPLAVALLLLDDIDGAEGEAQLLLSHAQTGRNEHLEAIAQHLLGRVALVRGEAIEAERRLHEALAIASRRDFRVQTLDALESLAHVASLTSSPAEAARLLAAVGALREQLGAVRWPGQPEVWTGIVRGVHAELGDEAFAIAWKEGLALSLEEAADYARRGRGERKRPKHGWESLTATELEVVRHAAAGLTNPQIGERMFVSRATVKVHLSHIFGKLGVSSRFELAAEATRRGRHPPAAPDAATP